MIGVDGPPAGVYTRSILDVTARSPELGAVFVEIGLVSLSIYDADSRPDIAIAEISYVSNISTVYNL